MNTNDATTQNKLRKRGRPRKNSSTTIKPQTQHGKTKSEVEEDIVLRFPISTTDITRNQANGFELIQTECEKDISSDSSLSDIETNEGSKTNQQLLSIIKEKDKLIEDLKVKLTLSTEIPDGSQIVVKNVRLYNLDMPFDKTSENKIVVPEYTKTACLWDTYEINGIPCFLPENYSNDTFFVTGWFCSLNCAVAYNLSLNDSKVNERYSLLKWMYGKTQETIHPAPPFRVLKRYGGNTEIEIYRKNLNKCEKDYRIIMPPMTYINQMVEEMEHGIKTNKPKRRNILEDMRHKKKNS